jgi:hypothetical protein
MKLYHTKIPQISTHIIETLIKADLLELQAEFRSEAEQDLISIMEEYLRRDRALREKVREYMHSRSVPYSRYGRIRSRMADKWGHPLSDDVERFLARQFVENFMMSRFIDEVFGTDKVLYKTVIDVLRQYHVDEAVLREEARGKVKNVKEGSVEYEIALEQALREVKKRHGLLRERAERGQQR